MKKIGLVGGMAWPSTIENCQAVRKCAAHVRAILRAALA
jgi:aspartate/glutamate racemase